MARILAIDYGLKRVGIAVTDKLQLIATSLTTVETTSLLSFLEDYLRNEEVEKVVIGYPVDLSGNETDATPAVKKFIKLFQNKFPDIHIVTIDERLTSRMASRVIIESGLKKMKRREKELVDKVSATIILQSYLEIHNR